jgi:hypothetical protein
MSPSRSSRLQPSSSLVPLDADGTNPSSLSERSSNTSLTLAREDLVGSRLFPNINSPERAGVVIAIAQNHNLDPSFVAANLAFIGQKPAMTGLLLAAMVKKSKRYRYKVLRSDNKGCSIQFLEWVDRKWEEIGLSDFTETEASLAGLLQGSNVNWKKYPKAMYFWRAMSQGVRMFAPDALAGFCCHLVEEVDPNLPVNEDGVPIVEAISFTRLDIQRITDILRECKRTGTNPQRVVEFFQKKELEDLTPLEAEMVLKRLNRRPTVSGEASPPPESTPAESSDSEPSASPSTPE